jgi:hypothetical protein
MLPNVDEIVPLMSKYIKDQNPSPSMGNVRQEAMKCFQVCPYSKLELLLT